METALEYATARDIVVETFRAELTERVYAIKRLTAGWIVKLFVTPRFHDTNRETETPIARLVVVVINLPKIFEMLVEALRLVLVARVVSNLRDRLGDMVIPLLIALLASKVLTILGDAVRFTVQEMG